MIWRALAAALFVAALAVAVRFAGGPRDGRVAVYMGDRRAPASVGGAGDYESVRASALDSSVRAQLMGTAAFERTANAIGLDFGHPVLGGAGGAYRFACAVPGRAGLFDRVRVTLYGTGISDNGDEPHLDVDTICRSSADRDRLDTIWIPMADIVSAQPSDGAQTLADAGQTVVTRTNMPGAWPAAWTLVSVTLYREGSGGTELTLTAAELRTGTSEMLGFDWPAR